MKRLIITAGGVALFATAALAADDATESPTLVETFDKACLMAGVDHADRQAAIEDFDGWSEDPAVSINVEGLQLSRSIGRKPNFKKYSDARQWSGMIDGRDSKVILLTFPEKERFKHACVVTVVGIKNAMPYSDGLSDAFKEFGIKRKSVDLVHYFEFSGKLDPAKQPVAEKHQVMGEIFTRSQAGDAKEFTHIYVAY